MPSLSQLRSRVYLVAMVGSSALLAFVIARAPLWNPVMAGARAQLGSGELALVPTVWRCSDYPYTCATTVAGEELVAKVPAIGGGPVVCEATYLGERIACTTRLWYAPQLKPFLELGVLPGVSFGEAMIERPWRVLDLGLLGESGPLHFCAGFVCSFLVGLGATAALRRGGWWWILRVALGAMVFVFLNAAWFMSCVFLGYID